MSAVDSLASSVLAFLVNHWLLTTIVILYATLFHFRSPVQFYVKYATYVAITMAFALCWIPFAMLRPNNPENVNTVSILLTALFRVFRINITLENSKYFQLAQPYILICNHQSSLDFLTLMKIWPGGRCTPLAKKELLYSGPFGIAIWLSGITFIDRLNPDKSRGTIDALADRINRENLRVWIFPEGTRNCSTELLPFKKGAFHLAIQAQVPIVCVVTSSYMNFYNKKEKKFLPNGQVKVRVLPPFQTRGMTTDSVGQLTKHLQDKMQKEFDKLNEEIALEQKYYTASSLKRVAQSSNKYNSNFTKLDNDDEDDEDILINAEHGDTDKKLSGKLSYSSMSSSSEMDISNDDSTSRNQNATSLSDDNNNSIEMHETKDDMVVIESKKSI